METIPDYENSVGDSDNIENTDIKINPDYYIHLGIVKALNALSNPDTKSGFLQYFVIVENIEIMADACGMLDDDFKNIIEDFRKNLPQGIPELTYNVRVAQEKLKHILKNIFKLKTLTEPMRLAKNEEKEPLPLPEGGLTPGNI
jgi:hypothetical protein